MSSESSMAAGRTIAANTGSLVLARFVVAALGWSGTVLIVRTLSVDGWGRFSFVFALLGVLSVFTDLGVGRVAIKGLLDAGTDSAAFAGTLVMLRAALGLGGYGLAFAVVKLGGYPPEVVRATLVAGVVVVLATPSHAIHSIFQAHLEMRTVAVSTVLGQLAQLGLIVVLYRSGGSVVLFCVPAVLGDVVILVWRLRGLRRLQRLRLRVIWSTWTMLLREAAPLAAGTVLATVYYRIDSVMLSKLDSFESVGIYGIAYKFVDLTHYLPVALSVSVLPVLVRAWPHDQATFVATFHRALLLMAIGGGLVAFEFAVFAGPVIGALYGQTYQVAADAGRLVVAAECIAAFGNLCFTALIAVGRNRVYPLAALIGLLLNVGLNLWLIPAYSYEGAAWATVVTEVVVLGLLLAATLALPAIRPLPLGSMVRVPPSMALAALAAVGAWRVVPWPAAAAAGAAVYVGCLHVLRAAGSHGLVGLVRGTSA